MPAIVDLAAMREAMVASRRQPAGDQSARARRTGDRPLRAGRRVRRGRFAAPEQRDRIRAQRRALLVPALGPDRVQQLQGRAAQHGHRAPGQPRAPRARRLRRGKNGVQARVPRHAGRHRLAHDDGQRPRRAGLGRRRHRGRGRDARPAGHDADPAGHRLPAQGRAAGGRDGHGPRADRHRDAAQEGRRRQVRRVLRRRARRRCRSPIARRSRTCRPSSAAPARSSRSTRRRCVTSSSPAAGGQQIALVEAYAKAQGMWRTNGMREADYTDVLELDLATVEPSLAGPEASAGPRAAAHVARPLTARASRRWSRSAPQAIPQATGTRDGHLGRHDASSSRTARC